ncbi:Tigger transposable element-derived protein 6 [Dictyocoela muelleri]|nr:Tigger transposable element-derived protein 6 [Dictyocoela muelleri]
MNILIFKQWLENLNLKMVKENRKILLTLDNASVHSIYTSFSNVELLHFPPNCTSKIQPCDKGIIRSFKTHYKKLLASKILYDINKIDNENLKLGDLIKKVTIFQALCFISSAWDSVSNETIIN